jgi:hypothetical protein
MSDIKDTIIDTTKPNAERIYDYFLGGDHWFPVDQQVADQIEKQMPFIRELARLTR